jgi:hypothetical protein
VKIFVLVTLAQHLVEVSGLLRNALGVAGIFLFGHRLPVTQKGTECVLIKKIE